ncbi:MAG: hypothetical protein WCK67_03300 [bacterium]
MYNTLKKISEFISGKKLKANKPLSKKAVSFLQSNENLQLNSKEKLKIDKVSFDAKKILKNFIKKPNELLKFIESKGTIVIQAKGIEKMFRLIGHEEGFIYPLTGSKALTLSIAINILAPGKIKISNKTPLMFVARKGPLSVYSLAHQFYHWVSYVKGLPGYEEETISNFKNIWSTEFNAQTAPLMNVDEILALKEAISRDMEAIQFVKEISREFIGSKKSLDKLKQGETLNI